MKPGVRREVSGFSIARAGRARGEFRNGVQSAFSHDAGAFPKSLTLRVIRAATAVWNDMERKRKIAQSQAKPREKG